MPRHFRVLVMAALVGTGAFLVSFVGANPAVRWVTEKAGGHPQRHPWPPHFVLIFAGFAAFCAVLGVIRISYNIR